MFIISIIVELCSENENDGWIFLSFIFIYNIFVISLLLVYWVCDKKDKIISSWGKGIDLILVVKFCLIFYEKCCVFLNF